MNKVFLCHSSIDKPLVRQIRKALLPFNQYLWLDELEILPGDSLIGKLSEGIAESDRVLVFISENSVNSKWVKGELQSFLSREIVESQTRVIPILVDSTPAPPFLNHKLQVRLNNKAFAKGVVDILKGILRRQSVFHVSPVTDKPYQLFPFIDKIEEFKKDGLYGNLFIVYDLYEFVSTTIDSLIQDEYQESDRLRIALPKCIDFLSAITPHLLKTVLTYLRNDAVGVPAAEKTIQIVWRLISLSLFNYMDGKVDEAKLQSVKSLDYAKGYEEVTRLESIRSNYIPPNYGVGLLPLAWLEYLDQHWDNTYDIGFAGTTTKDGVHILDAGRVRIPKSYIREDSLTVFRDTSPNKEFLPVIWVGYILPYIVADAILEYSFMGLDPAEIVPRIGLRKSDYYRFGIE